MQPRRKKPLAGMGGRSGTSALPRSPKECTTDQWHPAGPMPRRGHATQMPQEIDWIAGALPRSLFRCSAVPLFPVPSHPSRMSVQGSWRPPFSLTRKKNFGRLQQAARKGVVSGLRVRVHRRGEGVRRPARQGGEEIGLCEGRMPSRLPTPWEVRACVGPCCQKGESHN